MFGTKRVILIIAVLALCAAIAATLYYQPSILRNPTTEMSTTSPPQTQASPTPESATTSTQTPSTTSTTEGGGQKIGLSDLSTPDKLLSTFKHVKISVDVMNASGGKNHVSISFSIVPGEKIGNEDTLKLILNVSSENETETGTLWISKNYSSVLKLQMPNGESLVGPQANMYGMMILQQLNAYLLTTGDVGHLTITLNADGKYTTSLTGWEVTDVKHTTLKVCGNPYEGYVITLKNVNDTNSSAKIMEVGIAKLSTNLWYYSYINLELKNGGTASFKVNEIELNS